MNICVYNITMNRTRSLNIHLLVAFFFICISASTDVAGQNSLVVSPRRLLFKDRVRTQEISLVNNGKDTVRYSLSFTETKMKEDGTVLSIKDIEADSGQNLASKNLKMFPRYVELGPQEAQAIRVRLVNAGRMSPGEYRSNIAVTPIVKKPPLADKLYSTINLKLIPVVGVSIPVIILVGDYDGTIKITDLSFKMIDGKTARLFGTFERSGKMSVYGDLLVEHVTNQGYSSHVATARGVSIYTPNKKRTFAIDLKDPESGKYSSGTLKLVFVTGVEERQVKLADAQLRL
jgi:hypothetical protein